MSKAAAECSPRLRPIVIMALNAAMRRGEILSLKWDNVDIKHRFILLDRTKNGERRKSRSMKHCGPPLRAYRVVSIFPHVFINPDTDLPYGDIKNAFNRALRKAGIKDFHFHDLSHTFASHLVIGG